MYTISASSITETKSYKERNLNQMSDKKFMLMLMIFAYVRWCLTTGMLGYNKSINFIGYSSESPLYNFGWLNNSTYILPPRLTSVMLRVFTFYLQSVT